MKANERNHDEEFEQALTKIERDSGITLQDFDVEYPGENEIARTIAAMHPFVPFHKKKTLKESLTPLFLLSAHQLNYMSNFFWLSNLIFYALCFSGMVLLNINPYMVITIIAPLPIMTGLLEIAKSRNKGMAELEASLKYNLQEIILAKFVVVGVFNIILNLMATIIVSSFLVEVVIWELILCWMTPFTAASAITLILIRKIRNPSLITVSLVLWIAFVVFLSEANLFERLEAFPVAFHIIICIVGASICILRFARLSQGGWSYEFNR